MQWWIIFALMAAMTWAVVNIIDKYVLTKWIRNPLVPLVFLGVVGVLGALIVYPVFGFSKITAGMLLLTFIAGLGHLLMTFFYIRAVMIEEISRVVPLFSLAPLMVLMLATLFLGEYFDLPVYTGIFLLVIGAVLISIDSSLKLTFGKAFGYMMLANLSLAIHIITTKYLLDDTDVWTVFSYTRIMEFLCIIPFIFLAVPDIQNVAHEHGKKVVAVLSLNEGLNQTAYLFITLATAIWFATLVSAMASIQPFLVLLIATVITLNYPGIIREVVKKRVLILKFIAILLMFLGAFLVT